VNKTKRSAKTRESGQPRALSASAARGRPSAASRRISTDAPAKRFIAPRLSRAASELLRRYFGMQAAQTAGGAV